VFLSSGVWIVVGALLWCRLGVRWFFVVQLVAFFGQGASASLGDAMTLTSNLCEQLVTWALIVLGWRLPTKLEEARLIETAVMAETRSES